MNPDEHRVDPTPVLREIKIDQPAPPPLHLPFKPIYAATVLDIFVTVFLLFHMIQVWNLLTEILNKLIEVFK